MDSVDKRMQQLKHRHYEALDERAADLSTRISEVEAELRAFDRHLEKVEKRMPSVFDRLEDFQRALAKGYQSELSSVFESFDNAVGAVLDQMKSELKTGLSRIEGIEGMVDKRRRAEEEFGINEDIGELPADVAPEPGDFSDFDEESFSDDAMEAEEGDEDWSGLTDSETDENMQMKESEEGAEGEEDFDEELPDIDSEEAAHRDNSEGMTESETA